MIRIKNLELRIKLFIVVFISMLYSLFLPLASPVFASSHCADPNIKNQHVSGEPANHRYNGEPCNYSGFNDNKKCIAASGSDYWVFYCRGGCEVQYDENSNNAPFSCNRPDPGQSAIGKIFGQINAPQPIQQLGFGALGISTFLTNLVALIYSLAIVVLIFMILWGAWDWMTSEGDKEKLEGAKKKIVNAFIGIILFAIAFAVIRILGTFTGFKFFTP